MDRITAMRAFIRLVELESFSAVAAEMDVKQSTVSKWIAALEEEVGATLVARTTRQQQLTAAGRTFHQHALEIVGSYEDLLAEITDQSVRIQGLIRVSLPVVFGRLFVLPRLIEFAKANPHVELQMIFDDRYINLVEERIDLAIRVGTPADSSFRMTSLGSSERYLVASPGYVAAQPKLGHPRQLSERQCLLHSGVPKGTTWVFRQSGRAFRAKVRARLTANNSEALRSMARAGLGVALLASWLVDKDLASGRLVRLLPRYSAPPAPVQALTPPGRRTPPRTRALVELLRAKLLRSDA